MPSIVFFWRSAFATSLLLSQIALPMNAFSTRGQQGWRRQQQLRLGSSGDPRHGNSDRIPPEHLNGTTWIDRSHPGPKHINGVLCRSSSDDDNHLAVRSSEDVRREYAVIEGDDSCDDEDSLFGEKSNPSENDRRVIRVSSQIELPFSADIAYEAYSDLSRQPSWSSLLESVVLLDDRHDDDSGSVPAVRSSRWTTRVLGIRYSWTARSVRTERPHTIQWRSTTGLRNEGIVRFHRREGGSFGEGPTLMTLRMAFAAPRALGGLLRRSGTLRGYLEGTVIDRSLRSFRDAVASEQREQQQQEPGGDALTAIEADAAPTSDPANRDIAMVHSS